MILALRPRKLVRFWRPIPFFAIGFAIALAFAGLFLIAATRLFGAYAGIAVVLLVAVTFAVRWPTATAVTFIAFTPVNRFAEMVIFHVSHSLILTKGVELWKEAILGAILVRVFYDLFFTPTRNHKILALDLLAIFFILISAVYLVYPGPLNTDIFSRLQGVRADSAFMLAYFAGRGLHLNRARLRWIVMAIIPGSLATAAVAVFQFVAPATANGWFAALGYADFSTFLGSIGEPLATRSRSLTGADTLPRASSLMLSDLALSFYQVFTVSLAAAMFYAARRLRWAVVNGVFLALMFATLVMTLSRSAIASSAGAIVTAAVAARSVGRFALLSTIAVGAGSLILLTGYINITTVEALVNFQDPSAQRHEATILESVRLIQDYPFGRGLGTAGNIGQQQEGAAAITNESWYLQIGTEMGILGMIVYLALVALVMIIALVQFWKVSDYWLRTITLTVATSAGAMLVVGNFLHSWENTPLSMVFWLFAGIAVRARALEAAPDYSDQR